ncbi:MAG: transposase [Longicatena sp.]
MIEYSIKNNSVYWFYHNHKDEKMHIVKNKAIDFIRRTILHIPDHHFRTIRYYGFYSTASKTSLKQCRELLGEKYKNDFNEQVRKEKCGFLFKYIETRNSLEV